MNQEFRLSSLFTASFFRWLAIGVITTGVLAYFITSPVFVKPMYRSEAIIYVPLTLFTQQFDQQGIGFGSNVEIDGHIQILRSTQLLDSLIKQFDLTKQWNNDASDEGSRSRLYQKISSRVEITKTRYSSVSVRVRYYDPERAAAMANAIVRLGDVIKEEILLENRMNAYRFARNLYEQKQSEILAIEERFGKLTDERESQSPGAKSFRQRTLYEAELWELTARKSDYEKLRESLGTPLPRSYIVSSAVANYTPAWPARLPIITGVILLYIVVALFIQILRKDVQNT